MEKKPRRFAPPRPARRARPLHTWKTLERDIARLFASRARAGSEAAARRAAIAYLRRRYPRALAGYVLGTLYDRQLLALARVRELEARLAAAPSRERAALRGAIRAKKRAAAALQWQIEVLGQAFFA